MNWKFWKSKKNMGELTFAEINSRVRGFILDSQINNAHEIALILGASASSFEVMEKEEEESEKRVERISYLTPLIFAYSHALSEGAVEFQKTNLKNEMEEPPTIPDEVWLESRKLMEQVAISAMLGGISQLIDMGLLEVPKVKRRR